MKTVLAIETSCDETSIAIVSYDEEKNIVTTQAHVTASQADFHAQFGGVFPAMAKREHAKALLPTLLETLKNIDSGNKKPNIDDRKIALLDSILEREYELRESFKNTLLEVSVPPIDYIAVTTGPGLEPALWVGVNFARALGVLWEKEIVPTNHMEGHIIASVLNGYEFRKVQFPLLALLISGGHTELVTVSKWGSYEKIGNTLDDAIGEAFDKVARILGEKYPGGPKISNLAKLHREKYPNWKPEKPLPRPMLHSGNLQFSFSGLKTAVLYKVREIENMTEEIKQEISRDFEDSVTEVIIKKVTAALAETGAHTLLVGGGVAMNTYIKECLIKQLPTIEIYFPEKDTSTDNAKMIALASLLGNKQKKNPADSIVAQGSWEIGN